MKLNDILKKSFDANESELYDGMKLMDYSDWDSLNLMFFITKLEESYEIQFTGDEIAEMKTVQNVKDLIIIKGKTP